MARLVPAASRAFDILELFLEHDTLSAPDITAHLRLPRTTVHELVNTLVERSYLLEIQDGARRFELGPASALLGQRFQDGVDLSRQGHLVSRAVSDECNETSHVGVRDGASVIYIAKADSSHPVRTVSAIGRRLPAHCTAVGKVLLADLPLAELYGLYSDDSILPLMTERSIDSRYRLSQELSVVRHSGYATERCESNDDVVCVAASVTDATGRVVAGLGISVPVTRWDEAAVGDRLIDVVIRGAGQLTRRLGGLARHRRR